MLANAPYAYDGTITMALAMDLAGTTDGTAVSQALGKVSTPGTGIPTVTDYAAGLAAIKGGAKAIDYDGAGTTMDFNQYHNVFGPFQVVQWDPGSSQFKTIFTVSGHAHRGRSGWLRTAAVGSRPGWRCGVACSEPSTSTRHSPARTSSAVRSRSS